MNIKKDFAQDIAYIQEQFRLIEEERYYGGANGAPANGSLRKISENIKNRLNEIFHQIEKGEGSKYEKAMNEIFDIMDKK